jgi:malate dehydrogenase (oxaloacetate-decarboxylating)(NADP+)
VTKDMVRSMAAKPIIFAMANPDPEITPEEVAEVRSDAIVATGRSDYPTRSTTCWASLHLPRRARRAGLDHQRGDEDRRRQGAGRAGARGRARSGAPRFLGRQVKYGPDYIIPRRSIRA